METKQRFTNRNIYFFKDIYFFQYILSSSLTPNPVLAFPMSDLAHNSAFYTTPIQPTISNDSMTLLLDHEFFSITSTSQSLSLSI